MIREIKLLQADLDFDNSSRQLLTLTQMLNSYFLTNVIYDPKHNEALYVTSSIYEDKQEAIEEYYNKLTKTLLGY